MAGATAHLNGDAKSLSHILAGRARAAGAARVIGDAAFAARGHRDRECEQFLGLLIQRAGRLRRFG